MESLVVAEVKIACRQKANLEGQKVSALKVELGPRAHKEKNQEVESTQRKNPVRSRIELPLLHVILQPSITKIMIKVTYQCILEQCT